MNWHVGGSGVGRPSKCRSGPTVQRGQLFGQPRVALLLAERLKGKRFWALIYSADVQARTDSLQNWGSRA